MGFVAALAPILGAVSSAVSIFKSVSGGSKTPSVAPARAAAATTGSTMSAAQQEEERRRRLLASNAGGTTQTVFAGKGGQGDTTVGRKMLFGQ